MILRRGRKKGGGGLWSISHSFLKGLGASSSMKILQKLGGYEMRYNAAGFYLGFFFKGGEPTCSQNQLNVVVCQLNFEGNL